MVLFLSLEINRGNYLKRKGLRQFHCCDSTKEKVSKYRTTKIVLTVSGCYSYPESKTYLQFKWLLYLIFNIPINFFNKIIRIFRVFKILLITRINYLHSLSMWKGEELKFISLESVLLFNLLAILLFYT